MARLQTNCGQPSYTLNNSGVRTWMTVQGGHLTAEFNRCGRPVDPFYTAPWWKEERLTEEEVLNVLRGSFFCLPFGESSRPYHGQTYPVHGQPANDNWEWVDYSESNGTQELSLKMNIRPHGQVTQSVKLVEGEPLIYVDSLVAGYQGKTPVGYHPTVRLPEEVGAATLDISQPLAAFTTPKPVENPAQGGYSLLRPNAEVEDPTRVPSIHGGFVDVTRCPAWRGYEDIVLFLSNPERTFAYSALTVPQEGYLYFQLKNPRSLCATMLWMSHGGRHYPPWNGRVTNALGIEEVTAYFHYGIEASVESNPLQTQGFQTYVDLHPDQPRAFRIIMGLVPVGQGFGGVRDMVQKDESTIAILGRGGEEIEVPCQVGFVTDTV